HLEPGTGRLKNRSKSQGWRFEVAHSQGRRSETAKDRNQSGLNRFVWRDNVGKPGTDKKDHLRRMIMDESAPGMSTQEMQLWERRLDKAAEEIGYAMGLMVISVLANMPTPEDPEAHLKSFSSHTAVT